VIVVSTSPSLLAQAQAQAERYGNHRYLAKPFDLTELVHVIQEMIGGA
jgi:hypothetical protein